MTVEELIKILETYPKDCEVVIEDEVYDYAIIIESELTYDESSNKLFIGGIIPR